MGRPRQRPLWGPLAGLAAASCLCGGARAQGQPLPENQVPPGLRAWLGKDGCGGPTWVTFHGRLSEVVGLYNAKDFATALNGVSGLLGETVKDPHVAFDCATAVSSAFSIGALCSDQLQLRVLSARLRQLGAIFSAFDYQMKGEEFIDGSPWPIQWTEAMDNILRSMTFLKGHEMQEQPWRAAPARTVVSQRISLAGRAAPRSRIAIVSVCDYDDGATPLARLSKINKEAYAQAHGYDVVIYDKSPFFEDPLSEMFSEPRSHRPPAWSKVDALLTALAEGKHDWVMWMDCDSFFMDPEVRLEDVVAAGEAAEGHCREGAEGPDDAADLAKLVQKWRAGPIGAVTSNKEGAVPLQWYEDLLDEQPPSGCPAPAMGAPPPTNRTLGWSDWLYGEGRTQIIASEDGLMLNTGIMMVRASTWSWRFFQKVRAMTFARSPVTQHPWWEQTAMVYLLQLPFSLASAGAPQGSGGAAADIGPAATHRGYAPACAMLSQKQLNGYPPIVAAALRTHMTFEAGDFIVSFSGCKVYSSQEVCNQLFMSYFFQVHDTSLLQTDPALRLWA